jgi:hypothetical protein
MPNPSPHPYAAIEAHTRLMLLVAALAQNPGIGDRRTDAKGLDAMDVIQAAMVAIAAEQGIEYQPYSAATLRLDIRYLKRMGVMPAKTALHKGYYLGKKADG